MYYERERKLSLDHSFVLQEKIVDKVPKLNQLGEDSDSEIQELLAWVTDNRSWWLTMTDLSKVNIGLLLKEKKDESFFTWNSYLLYEHLNNLCYSLEMLNEIVERGCNEYVPVKRHIKVTVINIPVGILITNIMLFTLSFVLKLALIFYTTLVDLVATAVV